MLVAEISPRREDGGFLARLMWLRTQNILQVGIYERILLKSALVRRVQKKQGNGFCRDISALGPLSVRWHEKARGLLPIPSQACVILLWITSFGPTAALAALRGYC